MLRFPEGARPAPTAVLWKHRSARRGRIALFPNEGACWPLFDELLNRVQAGYHRQNFKRSLGRLTEEGRSAVLSVRGHVLGMVRPMASTGVLHGTEPFVLALDVYGEYRYVTAFASDRDAKNFADAAEEQLIDHWLKEHPGADPAALDTPAFPWIGFEAEHAATSTAYRNTNMAKALEPTLPRHRRIPTEDELAWLPDYIRDIGTADPIVSSGRKPGDRAAVVPDSPT